MIRTLIVAGIVGAAAGVAFYRGIGAWLGYMDAHQVGS